MLRMARFNFEQVLYVVAQRVVGCGGLFILGMGKPDVTDKICTAFESHEVISLDSTMLIRAGNC